MAHGVRRPLRSDWGVAVAFTAQPRLTQDVDAVIWIEESRWMSVIEAGSAYGFEPRVEDVLEFARRSRVLLMVHKPTTVGVDLSCGALPFEKELIERAAPINLGSIVLRVPTPEDLIISKAVGSSPEGSSRHRVHSEHQRGAGYKPDSAVGRGVRRSSRDA
jgi:hypothetical protein